MPKKKKIILCADLSNEYSSELKLGTKVYVKTKPLVNFNFPVQTVMVTKKYQFTIICRECKKTQNNYHFSSNLFIPTVLKVEFLIIS